MKYRIINTFIKVLRPASTRKQISSGVLCLMTSATSALIRSALSLIPHRSPVQYRSALDANARFATNVHRK